MAVVIIIWGCVIDSTRFTASTIGLAGVEAGDCDPEPTDLFATLVDDWTDFNRLPRIGVLFSLGKISFIIFCCFDSTLCFGWSDNTLAEFWSLVSVIKLLQLPCSSLVTLSPPLPWETISSLKEALLLLESSVFLSLLSAKTERSFLLDSGTSLSLLDKLLSWLSREGLDFSETWTVISGIVWYRLM